MGAESNGIIFDDLEWPLTQVSRSRCTYKSNISKMVHLGTKLLKNTIGNHTPSIEWYHFQWPWVTFDLYFKVMTTFFDIDYLRNDTR